MQIHLFDFFRAILGLSSGAVIGYAFGLVQDIAYRRHMRLEKEGKFKNAWAVMPGSGQRVAGLLLALVLVQVVCPLLFVEGTQWLVSGGLVMGYGWTLYTQMRQRLRAESQ